MIGDLSCAALPSQTRCASRSNNVPLSGPARSVDYQDISQIIVTPDQRLLVASIFDGVVLEFENPLKHVVDSNYVVPSSGLDEYYVFDAARKHLRTEDALTRAVRYSFGYGSDGLLESITDAVGATTQILRNGARAPQTIVTPDGLRIGVTLDGAGYLRTVSAPNAQLTTVTMDATGLLTQLTSPNGGAHTFSYIGGRLAIDQNPDQQSQTLSFVRDSTSQETVLTSPLGRTRRYRTEQLPTGDVLTVNTNRAGLADSTRSQGTAQTTNIAADGTVTTSVQESVDPRFGGDALQPTQVTVVQPSGLTSVLTSRRTVVADSLDPLRVISIIDSSQGERRGVHVAVHRGDADGRVHVGGWPHGHERTRHAQPAGRDHTNRAQHHSAGRLSDVTRDGVPYASYLYEANGNRTRRTSSAGIETGVGGSNERKRAPIH